MASSSGARGVWPAAAHRGLRRSAHGARSIARPNVAQKLSARSCGGRAARHARGRAPLRAGRGHPGAELPGALQSVYQRLAAGDARFDQSVLHICAENSTIYRGRSVRSPGGSSSERTRCLASLAARSHDPACRPVTATTTSNRFCVAETTHGDRLRGRAPTPTRRARLSDRPWTMWPACALLRLRRSAGARGAR